MYCEDYCDWTKCLLQRTYKKLVSGTLKREMEWYYCTCTCGSGSKSWMTARVAEGKSGVAL